jgi:aminoglycoside phosphotransferase (APT) family kinase protein
VDFRREPPSEQALRWAERSLGSGARVLGAELCSGGLISAVHRLTVEVGGRPREVVLRQLQDATEEDTEVTRREASTLQAARLAGLPAPELLASSPDGADAGGRPSILMTCLPGHIDLAPADPDDWLRQMARAAVRIHAAPIPAPPFERWIDPFELRVPRSATRPGLWQAVISALRQGEGYTQGWSFIHRDFQHFNFLWERGRLSGVVDWGMASAGPPDIDLGHCRLNLAVLFGADRAERLRLAYEAEAGRVVDPWWDLHAIASYGDTWPDFIPEQVAGRVPVDTAGMTARVEDLLAAVLRRLT